ncbi:MAG: nuclear transport factor 2 family protein [Allomuricauda sp.]
MPTTQTLESFITSVESESHDKVIEKYYTDDATIQENQSSPRVGRENLVANERRMLEKAKKVTSKCIRPYFVSGNHVIIKWRFQFEWLNGTKSDIEEIAYQTWAGNKIAKEQFFYDPQQFTPKS